MADDELRDAVQRIDDLEASSKFVQQVVSDNCKEFRTSRKDLETDIEGLCMQMGGPNKDLEREIADLKARVKELDGKLAKMVKE